MSANLITFAHFAVASEMIVANAGLADTRIKTRIVELGPATKAERGKTGFQLILGAHIVPTTNCNLKGHELWAHVF